MTPLGVGSGLEVSETKIRHILLKYMYSSTFNLIPKWLYLEVDPL